MPVTPSDADPNALALAAAAPAPAIFREAASRPALPGALGRAIGRAIGRAGLWLAGVDRNLPAIYAAVAIPLVIFFAVAIPAFRVPDEVRHFARAEQISTGGLLTWRQNSLGAGGIVDANIYKLDALIRQRVDWAGEERIDAALERAADAIAWGGERRFADMHGIGQYPPFHYVPAVAGIWVGKALGLSIADTLVVSRLFNGAVALVIALVALALMPHGRAALFAVLALPMTLHQFGSASQDALLIAFSALIVALAARAPWARRPLERGPLIALAALIAVNAMARPPMLALVLVLLVPGVADARRWPRTGAKAAALVTAVTLAWVVYVSLFARATLGDSETLISPWANLQKLLERPVFFVELVAKTWEIGYDNVARQFIGELGDFEVILPSEYHWFMAGVLAAGVAAALLERRGAGWRSAAIVGAAVLAGIFGILLGLYLTWTPLTETYIEGVQGRYFLPLALLLVAALPAIGRGAPLRTALTCFVAAAPLATLAVVPWAVMARYYIWPD